MTFLHLKDADNFPAHLKGGVVAIGNFDGVHRGHQSVLCAAVTTARANHVPATVLTFEPHPRTFFNPAEPVFRLTGSEARAELVQSIGFDCIVEHPFDRAFAATSAETFVTNLLLGTLGVSHVVTGYDFHFGKGREGSPRFLMQAGEANGFSATTVAAFSDEGGELVSSSRIRECLAEGRIDEANALLGYTWRVCGPVIAGKQLGRTMGYPTANLSLPAETTLKHGVYAVRVRLPGGEIHPGVASYGRRPTFDNGEALLESFLFDYDGDLYGQQITVFMDSFLRGEEKFDSIEALVAQMDRDSAEARAVFAALGPQHGLWPVVEC